MKALRAVFALLAFWPRTIACPRCGPQQIKVIGWTFTLIFLKCDVLCAWRARGYWVQGGCPYLHPRNYGQCPFERGKDPVKLLARMREFVNWRELFAAQLRQIEEARRCGIDETTTAERSCNNDDK